MTHSLRILLTLAVLAGAGACRVGTNPVRSPAATSPRGMVVELRLRSGEEGIVSGELLEVRDTALLLRTAGSIVLFPFDSFRDARSQPGPRRTRVRASDLADLRAWAPFARHPYGISEEQLDELLRIEGQDQLIVRDP